MRGKYYTLAGAAMLLAGSLLALQIAGGLEYTDGASFYTRISMIAAMATVAILPVFIHCAAHLSKALAASLFVGFVAFLAYSLPANVGRIGEIKEGKVVAKLDAGRLESELASARRTLSYAIPDRDQECIKVGPECRRKRVTVQALETQIASNQAVLTGIGNGRLGDVGSDTLAWALAPTGISSDVIRKASGLALAFGLEIVIWALVWLATVATQAASAQRRAPTVAAGAAATVAQDDASIEVPARRLSREEALADLRTLIRAGQAWPSQEWLLQRWGLPPSAKGTVSRWLSRWEAEGELAGGRFMTGRCKTVALREVA